MHTLTTEQVAFFKKNGYLHVPAFFNQEEVATFRAGCRNNKAGDSVCRPEFNRVMLSPKVIAVVKDLIGNDVIYPGLSLTRTKDFPKSFGSRFFHTDVVDDDMDYTHPYPIINTGIYLQDHIHYSNALKVIPGSHTRPCVTSKTISGAVKNIVLAIIKGNVRDAWRILNLHRSVNLPSQAGDLLIWYVRTHHSGYGVRPKFFTNWSLPPVLENWIPRFLRLPDNPDRDVMLSIYAAPSKYLEPYLLKQIKKGYRHEHYIGNSCLESSEVQELARSQGVTIRNDGYVYAKTHAPEKITAEYS